MGVGLGISKPSDHIVGNGRAPKTLTGSLTDPGCNLWQTRRDLSPPSHHEYAVFLDFRSTPGCPDHAHASRHVCFHHARILPPRPVGARQDLSTQPAIGKSVGQTATHTLRVVYQHFGLCVARVAAPSLTRKSHSHDYVWAVVLDQILHRLLCHLSPAIRPLNSGFLSEEAMTIHRSLELWLNDAQSLTFSVIGDLLSKRREICIGVVGDVVSTR